MDLRNELETVLKKNAGTPLAEYLTHCLNAFDVAAWREALAIRAAWFKRYARAGDT